MGTTRKRESAEPTLTPKQARFVEEYLVDLNATQAAIRAGYSRRTARQTASENLSKPVIQAAISEAQQARSKRTEITQDAVLHELALLGFANMLDYMTIGDDGYAVVDLSGLTREQAAAISEVVVVEYTKGRGDDRRDVKRIRFKLVDKRGPLVDLGKHLGLFGKPNGNGAHPAPAAVNIYNVTQDQVAAKVDGIFKRASEEQAKKRALN